MPPAWRAAPPSPRPRHRARVARRPRHARPRRRRAAPERARGAGARARHPAAGATATYDHRPFAALPGVPSGRGAGVGNPAGRTDGSRGDPRRGASSGAGHRSGRAPPHGPSTAAYGAGRHDRDNQSSDPRWRPLRMVSALTPQRWARMPVRSAERGPAISARTAGGGTGLGVDREHRVGLRCSQAHAREESRAGVPVNPGPGEPRAGGGCGVVWYALSGCSGAWWFIAAVAMGSMARWRAGTRKACMATIAASTPTVMASAGSCRATTTRVPSSQQTTLGWGAAAVSDSAVENEIGALPEDPPRLAAEYWRHLDELHHAGSGIPASAVDRSIEGRRRRRGQPTEIARNSRWRRRVRGPSADAGARHQSR